MISKNEKNEDHSQVNATVEIGAKASFLAEVKTEIPKESSGRFIDSLVDIFRPFSEARGLKADHIRLQREDVLIEIAKKARDRIVVEKILTEPLPLKVIVPLLEKASLEDTSDDYMMAKWAELLVSGATKKKITTRLVTLLSEINSDQAKLLDEIFFKKAKEDSPLKDFDGLKFDIGDDELYSLFKSYHSAYGGPEHDIVVRQNLFMSLLRLLSENPGLQLVTGGVWLRTNHLVMRNHMMPKSDTLDVNVLVSLNLLERRKFNYITDDLEFRMEYCQISDLGIDLITRCTPDARNYLENIRNSNEMKMFGEDDLQNIEVVDSEKNIAKEVAESEKKKVKRERRANKVSKDIPADEL